MKETMKKNMKKFFCLLLSAALLFAMVPAAKIQAAPSKYFADNITIFRYSKLPAEDSKVGYLVDNMPSNGKITNVKSSNKKALTVTYEYIKESHAHVMWLQPKNPGKSTMSFNVKSGKTTKKVTCKVTVEKYSCNLSSLKLGSKNYTSKLSQRSSCSIPLSAYKNKSVKVSVKAKKNWSVANIGIFDGKKMKTIKNNSKIKVTKPGNSISITLYNKKTNTYSFYNVFFS